MSNPDSYWQDPGDGDYGSGWPAAPRRPSHRDESPWDDAAGFWRDRDSSPRGPQPDGWSQPGSPAGAGGGSGRNGSGRDGSGRSGAGLSAGRSRRAARSQDEWSEGNADQGDDRTGRFSQTADDLRNRLGIRGSASRRDRARADSDLWTDPASPLAGRTAQRPAAAGARASAASRDGRHGSRAAADYDGDYGASPAGTRTALRDPDEFWAGRDAATGRGTRSRTAERTGPRRGGPGGGGRDGSGGRDGGGGGRFDGGQPRSRGQRFKNWLLYGSWWRHWTWKKALAVAGGACVGVILLFIAAFFILYEMTPIPTASELSANWQSSTVDFSNGTQMGTFDQNINGQVVERQLLTANQIPSVMTQAMTAAEDRHFYTEGGVSLTGLMRAAYEDVLGSGNLQGGSTITMQYAKNYYTGVNGGRNLSTKLKEIFIAMKLGHQKSKSWVMTNYLNTVPFGATIDGLGAAAENYFSVNLSRGQTLTVPQAAMLAAMPNNPAVFNPDPHAGIGYTLLVARWHYVLDNMVRDGNLKASVAATLKFPKLKPPPSGNGETGYTGYLMNMVEQQLEAPAADGGYGLTQQQIDTGGYRITTTFSMAKVKALARAVNEAKAQMRADGVPARNYDRVGAVLENSKTGAIVAIYGGIGYSSNQKLCNAVQCYINNAESAQQVGSSFKPYVLSSAVNQGMNVFTSKINGYSPIWIPTNTPGSTSAALTPSATSAPPGCPQPTSAVSNCLSSNGTQYFVFNESSENTGPLAVNVAAAISSDPGFEDLAHRDGIQAVIDMARQFGVGQTAFVAPCGASNAGASATVAETIKLCNDLTGPGFKVRLKINGQWRTTWQQGNGLQTNFSPSTKDRGAIAAGTPGSPTIALGANPLTPIEQASTFATLADDGLYHTPHVIATLQTGGRTIASPVRSRQVLSREAAADVDWALSFDNNYPGGTADGTVSFRRGDVIGKTGTLGSGANSSQAWFVGATPEQYALSVALFTNDPGVQNLDNLPSVGGTAGSLGGAWPADIWNSFMTAQFSGMPTVPLFAQTNGPPFVPWIQVQQQAPPTCKQGQYQNCTCPAGAQYCQKPNPTPTQTQPNPSPTCGQFYTQGCSPSPPTSTSPAPTPTPTSTTTCAPFGGPPCNQAAVTTSKLLQSAGAAASLRRAAGAAPPSGLQLAADMAAAGAAVLLRLFL